MNKLLIGILFASVLSGCSNQNDGTKTEATNSASSAKDSVVSPVAQKVKLTNFTEADVAKFVISSVMHQPTKIITVKEEGENYIISYKRRSDKQKFVYKVRVEGDRAIWANIDGRWRDSAEDEKVTFLEEGKNLFITQTFSDGSVSSKAFTK